MLNDAENWPMYRARCCRDWPVFLGVRMRPCGYCGVVPKIIGTWEEEME